LSSAWHLPDIAAKVGLLELAKLLVGGDVRFRIRSSERDKTSDADRLQSIKRAILSAMDSAQSEEDGLKRRLEGARTRASMLVGNEAFENQQREVATEHLLAGAEREFAAAAQRIRQLADHREHLARVLQALKQA
jgi:hypothetical protein